MAKTTCPQTGDESFDAVIERELTDDDTLAGFGAWSDTAIDESVNEVKQEMDNDFETES
ncbi:hypothetical protein [Halocatena halophila]|uniref:hypothetical protein n=1 Tax=Halocatena halophila TaxID=2814576 RepID=UPI002ED40884